MLFAHAWFPSMSLPCYNATRKPSSDTSTILSGPFSHQKYKPNKPLFFIIT
jgi:hypothetical protein